MRAFQLLRPGHAEICQVAVPEPRSGEALLRVSGAGVCHSDVHLLHAPQAPFRLPFTLGHEIAGTVEALGPATDGWEIGEPALVYLCWGCGTCRACARGADNYCEARPRATVRGAGLGRDGGMADLVAVPLRHMVRLGELDPIAAAPLTDAGLTSYHAVAQARERLAASAAVAVVGVGGLGHMAVQILASTTAATIIAVDSDEGRLRHAAGLGASHAVPAGDGAAAEILAATGGRGADVVLDFVGVDETLELAAACVATAGQITIVGVGGGRLRAGAIRRPPASRGVSRW